MSKSTNNHRPRVSRGADKLSDELRKERSLIVKGTAVNCPAWLAHPGLGDAGEDLIQAGLDLGAGETLALQLTAQAETARKALVTLRVAWDEKYDIYAGNGELYAFKPQDLMALGLPVLEEASYKLAPPLGVTARYDLTEALIRIMVQKPPGDFRCQVETRRSSS